MTRAWQERRRERRVRKRERAATRAATGGGSTSFSECVYLVDSGTSFRKRELMSDESEMSGRCCQDNNTADASASCSIQAPRAAAANAAAKTRLLS
eukprot:1111870-Prorocentrum_minimum.AAC.1